MLGAAILTVPVIRWFNLRNLPPVNDVRIVDQSGNPRTWTSSFWMKLTNRLLSGVSVGTLLIFADAVVLQVALGVRWGAVVVAGTPGANGNAPELYATLREVAESTVRMAIAAGTVIAMLLGRWMFRGRGAIFTLIFLTWVAAATVLVVALVTADSVSFFFDELFDAVRGRDVDFGSSTDYCDHLDGWTRTYCEDVRVVVVFTAVGLIVLGLSLQVLGWSMDVFGAGMCCAVSQTLNSVATSGSSDTYVPPQTPTQQRASAARPWRVPALPLAHAQLARYSSVRARP